MSRLKLLLFTILIILAATSAASIVAAHIDIVNPADDETLGETTVSFDYYVAMPAATGCTLTLDSVQIPDPTITQGLNAFLVDNVDPGTHAWNIECINGSTTEQTGQSSFLIDLDDPEVTIHEPTDDAEQLELDFVTIDNHAATMECLVIVDGVSIDQLDVTNNTHATQTYDVAAGDHTLHVACADEAGNEGTTSRDFTILQTNYLRLKTNKQTYGLGEPVLLTIDAPEGANVSVDICPDGTGFVQCFGPLIDNDNYPQSVVLPQVNLSGNYLVEGIANLPGDTVFNSTSFTVENTLSVTLELDSVAKLREDMYLVANAYGGLGELTFEWTLENGTKIDTGTSNTLELGYREPGVYDELVTVRDEGGNEQEATIRLALEETHRVELLVKDNSTGNPLQNTSIELVGLDETHTTNLLGKVSVVLPEGTTKLYISKPGYEYLYSKAFVDENSTVFSYTLEPLDRAFAVVLKKPADAVTFTTTQEVAIQFVLEGAEDATCSLNLGEEETELLEQKETLTVADSTIQQFTLSGLPDGAYSFFVECVQGELIARSGVQQFTMQSADKPTTEQQQSTGEARDFDKERDYLQQVLDYLETLDQDEQELMKLLGIKVELRKARRAAGQYGRDLFDLKYREDLNADELAAEQNRMEKELRSLITGSIVDVDVVDTKQVANYVTDEELATLFEEQAETIENDLGIPPNKKLLALLTEAQQRYTLATTLYHVRFTYGDGTVHSVSVISKEYLYGKEKAEEGAPGEQLIEYVPFITKQDELEIYTKESTPLGAYFFSVPAESSLIYALNEEVAFSELESAKTILVPRLTEDDLTIVTGNTIFGAGFLGGLAQKLGISLGVLLVLLFAGYLVYYFNLFDQIKYLFYEAGPKKKMHYLRVIINEALDTLHTGDYDKALLIYKEVKLTYDKLETPAKNELFEQITELCAQLDRAYMNRLIIRMDEALKENNLQEGIRVFSKIEGTFHRLPEEEQEKVIRIVEGLAKRLGLTKDDPAAHDSPSGTNSHPVHDSPPAPKHDAPAPAAKNLPEAHPQMEVRS